MESWCAYQERSIAEATQKLSGFGVSRNEASSIIDYLRTTNFLDNIRFTEAFVHGKFNIKSWGKQKIKSHLIQKHKIPNDLIEQAFNEIEDEEYDNLILKLANRKKEEISVSILYIKRKKKVIRFLQSRGFELSKVFDIVNKLEFKDLDDDSVNNA